MCLGLGNGYIEPKEEKKTVTLLKPYTNFDNVRNMNIEELAEKLAIVELNAAMAFCKATSPEEYSAIKEERKNDWIEWLGSEAEK